MAGLVDIHCHVLPGVDDGADSDETGLAMLRRAVDEGVTALALTPHVRPEDGPERLELLTRRFAAFRQVAAGQVPGPGLQLHQGAELGFRFGLAELAASPAARIAGGPYVLVDLPPGPLSPALEQAFFEMRTAGHRPLLAHPERHRQLAVEPERLRRLRDQDLRLQVDAGSLRGRFGSRAREAALRLVRDGLADCVASDGHDLERRPLSLRSAYDQVAELAGEDEAGRLFCRNPAHILAGRPLEEPAAGAGHIRRSTARRQAPGHGLSGWLRRLTGGREGRIGNG